MGDFDTDQLSTDALGISGPSGSGGEPFVFAGATYYGVFGQDSQVLSMDATGFKQENTIVLDYPRASLTVGITANLFVYRPFDATTYQVQTTDVDLQWHRATLRKQFETT